METKFKTSATRNLGRFFIFLLERELFLPFGGGVGLGGKGVEWEICRLVVPDRWVAPCE